MSKNYKTEDPDNSRSTVNVPTEWDIVRAGADATCEDDQDFEDATCEDDQDFEEIVRAIWKTLAGWDENNQ